MFASFTLFSAYQVAGVGGVAAAAAVAVAKKNTCETPAPPQAILLAKNLLLILLSPLPPFLFYNVFCSWLPVFKEAHVFTATSKFKAVAGNETRTAENINAAFIIYERGVACCLLLFPSNSPP